jgi:hypothetical protein
VTVGLVLPEPVLLETTPLSSTPEMVKVYVPFGVTPFGVAVVVAVLLPHAGIRINVPLNTKRANSHQAFRARFPPAAAPSPTSASMGKGSHIAYKRA